VVLEDLYTTILELAATPVPARVDGESLVPEVLGTGRLDREYIHGEHSSCYSPAEAMQFVTDGREKYVWYTQHGDEQFFDLETDPQELHDLAGDPREESRLQRWRGRLVERLRTRPDDGLTDGGRLTPGTLVPAVRAPATDG
jgi:arylsulfatase A-like enzyme